MSAPGVRAHHDDPGLQPERTSLSWTRTVLSLLICSLTLLRWAHAYPQAILVIVVVMVLLGVVFMLTQGRRYADRDAGLARGAVSPAAAPVLLLTASLMLFACSELVLIVLAG